MKIILILALNIIITSQALYAAQQVKIIALAGDVKIRRGLDEHWQTASNAVTLENIDTILTGEAGEVTLKMENGDKFTLGSNSILDIADLREITERELFLYLMSQKIDKIGPREGKTKLKIGRVNVVHGELKSDSAKLNSQPDQRTDWLLEKNGARALFGQNYTTNAIFKFNKILLKYPDITGCGELNFHIGQAFEKLNKPGQAAGAYKQAIKINSGDCAGETSSWVVQSEAALKQLNQ